MKVVLLQQDIVWANPSENLRLNRLRMESVPDADLYLLPEMFATGFVTNPVSVAEELVEGSCASLELMKEWAAARNAAVCGSLAVHDGDLYRNRFYFVKPDGSFIFYNKHHLFAPGGEPAYITPGHERVVVEWRGLRFLLLVCYDLRFPAWCRNRGDFDAILLSANWPGIRRKAWDILAQARAVENQCYVLAVNRIGSDPKDAYNGGTRAISPYGDLLAVAPDDQEFLVEAQLNPEFVRLFQEKFPVGEDADDFLPPYTEARR
ncbi:MAG: nitrilase family protein [Bacteroidales bacterium]|nr:nitrilase family protein [Bacteroidales bacterium]